VGIGVDHLLERMRPLDVADVPVETVQSREEVAL
jgi:hypothetical protein